MITFENVGFRYGEGPEVLRDVSLRLEAGSRHFLTGASGAGKSSFLRLLYLDARPTRGRLTLFGRDIATLTRDEVALFRRRIGVVFQDFRLLDHLSAADNVALPLLVSGAPPHEFFANVSEMLDWVGLGDKKDARPPELSGGEKQRVAIARAVVAAPDLLLADEPTGSVDPEMGERIMTLFQEMNRMGKTVVIATHDRSLTQRYDFPSLVVSDGLVSLRRAPTALPGRPGGESAEGEWRGGGRLGAEPPRPFAQAPDLDDGRDPEDPYPDSRPASPGADAPYPPNAYPDDMAEDER